MIRRILRSCYCSALAAAFGLSLALGTGVLWWPPGAALTLTGVGLAAAGCFARLLASRWDLPASVVAAGIGAMVGCFFAGASAEVLPAGSLQWMFKGGLYGACFGLPLAAILGPIGLVGRTSQLESRTRL